MLIMLEVIFSLRICEVVSWYHKFAMPRHGGEEEIKFIKLFIHARVWQPTMLSTLTGEVIPRKKK